jgi:hypothetical protein
VSITSPRRSIRSRVPPHHLRRRPSVERHQVGFLPASLEELVREEVTERMWMEPWHAGLLGALPDHLAHAARRYPPPAAEPEPRRVVVGMLRPCPEVAVDRLRRSVPEARDAHAPTFPEDSHHPRVEVDVGAVVAAQLQAGELRKADARVGEQSDDRGVPSILEVVAWGALEDRLDVSGRGDGYCCGIAGGFMQAIGDAGISPSSCSQAKNATSPR